MKTTATILVCALAGSSVMAQSALTADDVHREEQAAARELLTHDQLSPADILRVLTASYVAMRGRTYRVLDREAEGQDDGFLAVQMGPSGRPRYVDAQGSSAETFEDYTATPAHSCSGTPLEGTLVIEYAIIHDGLNPVDRAVIGDEGFVSDGADGRIRVGAHLRDSREPFLQEVFEMYANERPLSIGPRDTIDGHKARAFITHHEQRPVDREASGAASYPPEFQDWLWIDVKSLDLVRWETRYAGKSTEIRHGYVFVEAPGLRLHPPTLPKGLKLPTCVDLPK